MERKLKDHIQLEFEGEWTTFGVGDLVPLEDGVYVGKELSAVAYGGHLVAAWEGKNYIIPHGTWNDREKGEIHKLENTVAHITMSSLQEGCRRENLDWKEDCVPRLSTLLELLSLEIEPIHICMVAACKLKRKIKEGTV